jgi:hypothetical protein
MRYPSAYVLICESDEKQQQEVMGVGEPRPNSLTPSHFPSARGAGSEGKLGMLGLLECRQTSLPPLASVLGQQITEKVAQDAVLSTGTQAAASAKR